MDTIVGTDLKINVNIEPIDGTHMEEYDFTCRFFIYRNRYVELTKERMIRQDSDNYLACIGTASLGEGEVKMTIEAKIPDSDFPSGIRTEIVTVSTGITISR